VLNATMLSVIILRVVASFCLPLEWLHLGNSLAHKYQTRLEVVGSDKATVYRNSVLITNVL
jgi:hypothetical protein